MHAAAAVLLLLLILLPLRLWQLEDRQDCLLSCLACLRWPAAART